MNKRKRAILKLVENGLYEIITKAESDVWRKSNSTLCYQVNKHNKPSKKELQKTWYKNYLKSDTWRTIRNTRLKFDNYKCVKCGLRADEVHHLTYINVENENLEDLMSLCIDCHKKEHEKKL